MIQHMGKGARRTCVCFVSSIMICLGSASPAWAQDDLEGSGQLIRQDFSDCGNSNVSGADPSRIGGNAIALQTAAGATTVNMSLLAGTPNTSYNVYWKCHNQIGTIRTGADGTGSGSFSLQTTPGTVLTFDIYPTGAPAGNKFQSVRLLPAPAH